MSVFKPTTVQVKEEPTAVKQEDDVEIEDKPTLSGIQDVPIEDFHVHLNATGSDIDDDEYEINTTRKSSTESSLCQSAPTTPPPCSGVPQMALIYTCQHCQFRTKYKYSLLGHMLKIHKMGELPAKRHECPHCEYRSQHRGHLNRHLLQRHHIEGAASIRKCIYKCALCTKSPPYSTYTYEKFKVHMRTVHGHRTRRPLMQALLLKDDDKKKKNSEASPLGKIHKCRECDFRSAFPRNLRRHQVEQHSTERLIRIHECDQCHHKFKRRADMLAHQKRVHFPQKTS